MSLTQDLRVWRKKRNITNPDTKVFVINILEELLEIYYKDKNEIEEIKDSIWSLYFVDALNYDLEPISEENTIDSIQDIQVFSINETELMGYDNDKCNYEVFKEINSRVQCPMQKEDWKNNGAFGKWKKSLLEKDVANWYKADYFNCKLIR